MRVFSRHPSSVGETYLQHLGSAARFGIQLFAAGTACFLHGLFPFLFERTGSEAVKRLNQEMVAKRSRSGSASGKTDDVRPG